jgi:hypothetical protein
LIVHVVEKNNIHKGLAPQNYSKIIVIKYRCKNLLSM